MRHRIRIVRGAGPLALFLLLLGLITGPVLAHDYWLAPERFAVEKGGELVVRLFVGMDLEPDTERELQKDMTERFVLVAADGAETDLLDGATFGGKPVLRRKLATPGARLLRMDRAVAHIELEDEKFTEYLEHEGLADAAKLRAKVGHREKERERYRRYLKSLVAAAPAPHSKGLHDRPLGQKIEILLLDDPFRERPGEPLRAKVLFDGKPLAGRTVWANHRDDETGFVKLEARTDENGVATFRPERPGLWVVRLIHMRVCPDEKVADWESFWASFSFELPGGDGEGDGQGGDKDDGGGKGAKVPKKWYARD